MNAVQRIFSAIGLVFIVTAFFVVVTEMGVRVLLKPDANSDLTVNKTLVGEDLCRGLTDPYERRGECYSSFDSLAKMSFSTYFGYVPLPNTAGRGYYTNSSTMRYDKDIPIIKEKNEYRIFVTGGSTAWGAGVSQAQLYSKEAEDILSKRFVERKIKVVSAGVGGYVTLHELLRYKLYVRPLKPNIWVMYTGWNDIYAGYSGRKYALSPDMLNLGSVVTSGAKDDPILRDRMAANPQDKDPSPKRPLWDGYRLKINWLVDMALYKQGLKRERSSETTSAIEGPQSAEETVGMLLDNISIASHIAKRDGIQLLVVLQPSLYATRKKFSNYEATMIKNYTLKHPDLEDYFQKTYPALREGLRRAAQNDGIAFIDADEAITSEKKSVFADHVHFGDRGNALIGRYMANKLQLMMR